MTNPTLYTDPLGNKLTFEEGVYVVEYAKTVPEREIGFEDLPFQVGDLEDGVNGVSNELMIEAIIHRLQRLETKHSSIFNRLAIQLLHTTNLLLEAKAKDDHFRSQFKNIKLHEADENALEVIRWNIVVKSVQTVSHGLRVTLQDTYKVGKRLSAVDIRRIKRPEIIRLFQSTELNKDI